VGKISEKTVIGWLEQVALIEPTSDGALRAIGRAREALGSRQPSPRQRYAKRTLVAVCSAAALVILLVPFVHRFSHNQLDSAAKRLAPSDPAAKGNALAPKTGTRLAGAPPPGSLKRESLNRLPNNYLKLNEREDDAVLLALIERLPKTSWVEVGGSRVTDAGLAHLKMLTELTRVEVGASQVTSEGTRHLQTLTGLEFLEINHATNDSVAQLKELTNVTRFGLSYTGSLTNEGVAHLARMKQLKQLMLANDPRVGDAGLAHLEGLTNLRELDLNQTAVTDDGLKHLQKLEHLERLDLGRTNISDAGLKYLANLTTLKELQLGHTRVTSAGLAHLAALTNLWSLGLNRLDVTDAGLEHLTPLKKLMVLQLKGTNVSDAAVEKFRKELPHSTPSTFGER